MTSTTDGRRSTARNSLRFTASKCPADEDATCELPFGFLWSPFVSDASSTEQSSRMDLCPTCLAYRNVYCQPSKNNATEWTCPFCQFTVVSDDAASSSTMIHETVSYRQPVSTSALPDTPTLVLVLDGNLPPAQVQAMGTLMESVVAQSVGALKLGLIVFDSVVSVYQLPTAHGLASCQDFVGGDDTMADEAPYLLTVTPDSSLAPLWTCLAARFGSDVRSNSAMPPTTKVSRLEQLKQAKAARMRGAATSSPTTVTNAWATTPPTSHARCTADAIQCASELLVSGDRLWLFTNGCPNQGAGNCCTEESRTGSIVDPHKVTATSVPYFSMLGPSILDGVLVDVFLSGNSALAVPVYHALVEASAGYVVVAPEPLDAKALVANGLQVWQHTQPSLGQYVVSVSDAATTTTDADTTTTTNPTTAAQWIEGCTADIRLSSCLTATHLIGPGELVDEITPLAPIINEQEAFDANRDRLVAQYPKLKRKQFPAAEASSVLRVKLGRYDPLSTFSVMLQLNDSFQPRFDTEVLVQVVIRYVENGTTDTLVTRVTTHRLKVAGDVGEFLEVVDEDVVPVVLAKEAVYRSMTGRGEDVDRLAYDAQRDLDQTIFQISAAFRLLSLEHGTKSVDLTEDGGRSKAAGTSMDFAFPPELSEALRRLYHMRRGPFLSPGPLQSVDDRAALRAFFVRFPLDECLAMMAPELWSSGPLDVALRSGAPLYESVPPDTLSLWENRIIAADHWNSLFLWSGDAVANRSEYQPILDQLRDFLRNRSQHRFPAPSWHVLTQSDASMSRRFTALLAPLHGDPVEHQLVHFAALSQLTATEQEQLRARFRFYDPEADPSFRSWFWDVVSAAHGGQQQQHGSSSLCD